MTAELEISETVLEGEPSTGTQTPNHLYRIATLQERFAGFFLDLIINVYLIAGWKLLLSRFLKEESFPLRNSFVFITGSVGIYLLYHIFFEGALTTTPGKFLGGLTVHRKGGGTPSLGSIFVRNLFRLVDYPLFFVAGAAMETTKKCRRLGDLLAGTVVLRKMPFQDSPRAREEPRPAAATLRTIAFLIDLFPTAIFCYGLLLLIPVQRKTVSLLLLNLSPLLVLLYFSFSEAIFQTTFGKVLFGFKVVREEDETPSFASIVLRNLSRLVDMNPLGYLCALLSNHKQRPGDIITGTLVVKAPRKIRGWFALLYMLLLAAVVGTLGWFHPNSFYRKNYTVQIGRYPIDPIPIALQRYRQQTLFLERFNFAFNETQVNGPRRFDHGDVIFLLFRVSGYMVINDRAWIQGDLKVRDPKRNIVLDRVNVINTSIKIEKKRVADLAARFALHPQAIPGRYELELTLRDRLAKTAITKVAEFTVQ